MRNRALQRTLERLELLDAKVSRAVLRGRDGGNAALLPDRLATLSTGEEVENQAFLKTALKKLRQANKRLHRRKLGSKNREKARRQVARLHYRITCLRQDVLQKLTTRLVDSYGIIGVEDLHLKGLLKNRRLARSFADASLGALRRLLEVKAAQRGGQVIKVGRFFPSSKTCHCCGWTWEAMRLKDRIFVCQNPACPYDQFPQDRDHNAGQNMLREALRLIGLIDQAVSGTGSDELRHITWQSITDAISL